MAFDPIVPPRRLRTATERFRDAIYERRADDDVTEIRLLGVHAVHGHGSPPAGMFNIHAEEGAATDDRPARS
jgi:hypothetical protein